MVNARLLNHLKILHGLSLPRVEYARLEAVLVTQVGDRHLVPQVTAQDGSLLLRRELPAIPLLVHV
jgi:hypothetical protein